MKRNAFLMTIIAGLAFMTACGEKKEPPPASGSISAHVLAIRTESVPAVLAAPGTVQPRHRIALSSQLNGFVREVRVRAGDSVRQDQVLATLDARDAESQKAAAGAAIDEAQAAIAEAQKARLAAMDMRSAAKASADLAGQTLTRYQKLFDSRSVSPQEIDEVRARRDAGAAELASRESMVAAAEERIRQAEARLSQAKAQAGRADVTMSWTQIKAPSSGKIAERAVDPGTAIFPGTPLFVIESTVLPQVLADIPTEQADRLRIGMAVGIRSTDKAGMLNGKLSEIIPQSNPATHSVQFKVDLGSNAAVSSGQFVTVEIPEGTRPAILVPHIAIRHTGQLTGVFVVDAASKARFRLVKSVPFDAARAEILSGVEPGENIIAELSDTIIDGISVENRQ